MNDFTLVNKLGNGKFATVYLAIHNKTGFLVALKIMSKILI